MCERTGVREGGARIGELRREIADAARSALAVADATLVEAHDIVAGVVPASDEAREWRIGRERVIDRFARDALDHEDERAWRVGSGVDRAQASPGDCELAIVAIRLARECRDLDAGHLARAATLVFDLGDARSARSAQCRSQLGKRAHGITRQSDHAIAPTEARSFGHAAHQHPRYEHASVAECLGIARQLGPEPCATCERRHRCRVSRSRMRIVRTSSLCRVRTPPPRRASTL